jgi:hypothetical protein
MRTFIHFFLLVKDAKVLSLMSLDPETHFKSSLAGSKLESALAWIPDPPKKKSEIPKIRARPVCQLTQTCCHR